MKNITVNDIIKIIKNHEIRTRQDLYSEDNEQRFSNLSERLFILSWVLYDIKKLEDQNNGI